MKTTLAILAAVFVLAACGGERVYADAGPGDAGRPVCDPTATVPRPTCVADVPSCDRGSPGWVLTCPGLDGPVRFACSGGGAAVCISDTLAMSNDAHCVRTWCAPGAG